MSKTLTTTLALSAAMMLAAPTMAGEIITYDSPTYSLGALNAQDGWVAGGGNIVNTNPSPINGQSVQDGWNSARPTDATYSSGTLYASLYVYFNGSAGNENATLGVLSNSADNLQRAFMAGVWGTGASPGIWTESNQDASSFTDAGWYGIEIEMNLDTNLLVEGKVIQIDTGLSEVVATNRTLGWNANTFGGSIDQMKTFIEGGLQLDHFAYGRELVPIIPEPASIALLGLGGLMLLRRKH